MCSAITLTTYTLLCDLIQINLKMKEMKLLYQCWCQLSVNWMSPTKAWLQSAFQLVWQNFIHDIPFLWNIFVNYYQPLSLVQTSWICCGQRCFVFPDHDSLLQSNPIYLRQYHSFCLLQPEIKSLTMS